MNINLIKQHVSEIEDRCSFIRMAAFSNDSAAGDKIWSNATAIMSHTQQLQVESGSSITKTPTDTQYKDWCMMVKFSYGFTHKEKHAFKAIEKLIEDNPTAPAAILMKLISEHIANLRKGDDAQYLRFEVAQLTDYSIVFKTRYALTIATLERRPENA
jgi:hypothetical protein